MFKPFGEGEAADHRWQSRGNSGDPFADCFGYRSDVFHHPAPSEEAGEEEQKMRNNMRVGDEITTIGGICGRVVTIRDDSGDRDRCDRNKMTIKKWAVQSCDTVHDPKEDDDDDDDDDDI